MAWMQEYTVGGLPIQVESHHPFSMRLGPRIAFHAHDEKTVKAIQDRDPVIFEIFDTVLSCIDQIDEAQWAEDSTFWERAPRYRDFEDRLAGLAINPYASDHVKVKAAGLLREIEEKRAAEIRARRTRGRLEYRKKKVRKALIERDGATCAICGSTEDLCIDHIVPVSKGGDNDLDNLQLLCRPCNSAKKDKLPEGESCTTS